MGHFEKGRTGVPPVTHVQDARATTKPFAALLVAGISDISPAFYPLFPLVGKETVPMPDRKLKLVPKSAAKRREAFRRTKGTVTFQGSDEGKGDTNFVCGQCDYVLAETIDPTKFAGMVMICPECRSYNDTEE